MKFSIGSWSFRELYATGEMSVFGYLQSLKYRYHLDCADLWPGMFTSTDDDYFRKIKAVAAAEGIAIASLASDMLVWHDDPAVRESRRKDIHRYLDIAALLGTELMGIDIGVDAPHMTEQQFDYVAEQYASYAQIASDRGFRIAVQNHKAASQIPRSLKQLIEAVGSPSFGIILDLGRWDEDQEIGDQLCAPYAMHVHFDSSRMADRASLESKVQLLLQSGYTGCWSLEYLHGKDAYLGVECDLAALRRAVHLAAKQTPELIAGSPDA